MRKIDYVVFKRVCKRNKDHTEVSFIFSKYIFMFREKIITFIFPFQKKIY